MDCLPYWQRNCGVTTDITLISVDLAQYEIFCTKVWDFWQGGIIVVKPDTHSVIPDTLCIYKVSYEMKRVHDPK